MIFQRKKNAPGKDSKSNFLLSAALFRKGHEIEDPLKRVQGYWKVLEKLSGFADKEEKKPGNILDFIRPFLYQVPHENRQELLGLPAVDRLAQLSPALSYSSNLEECSLSTGVFQKARSRLNRFRSHVGGSSMLSLEAIQAVLVYLVLFMNLSQSRGDEKWIQDSTEFIEPFLKPLVGEILHAYEKKIMKQGVSYEA